jgi:hypothetical protein
MVASLDEAYGPVFAAPPPAPAQPEKRKRRREEEEHREKQMMAPSAAPPVVAPLGGRGCPTEIFYLILILLIANLIVCLRISSKLDMASKKD